MADTFSVGGSNGEQARAETQKAGEHLKSAGRAAADTLRDNAAAAGEAARNRAQHATDWARSRFEDLQGRVEERPQSSALWALGIGVVTGFLIGTLMRGGHD